MKKIEMVVFDMAGTTIRDNNEVEKCFNQAMEQTGLITTHDEINSMMGWSKVTVFETLWKNKCPELSAEELSIKINQSYNLFKEILENYYSSAEIVPTIGTIELFNFLKEQDIKIALTTGFYRKVTDIILTRLGWNIDFDLDHCGTQLINASIASDEVKQGRPAPFMLYKAMEKCGVVDVKKVVKIGDTPSDLGEGTNANCLYSFGVTNGTHTKHQLAIIPNDGLYKDMYEFKSFLEKTI